MGKTKLLSINHPINIDKTKLLTTNPKRKRSQWKICISDPFLNCEKIYPLQQKKVAQIISILKNNPSVAKIIVFGSSTTDRCHIDSDVDVFVNLSSPSHISLASCDFVYDLWTNYTVDQRLLSEIMNKGVTVYVSNIA